MSLMAGKEAWTDPKVKAVFDHWAELLPYHQDGSMGRTWQDAAQTLVSKKAGMYVLGSFVAQQFTNKADLDDLDFFAFPEINSPVRPGHRRGTHRRLHGLQGAQEPGRCQQADGVPGHCRGREIYLKADSERVAASSKADTCRTPRCRRRRPT